MSSSSLHVFHDSADLVHVAARDSANFGLLDAGPSQRGDQQIAQENFNPVLSFFLGRVARRSFRFFLSQEIDPQAQIASSE
jgi:hypothetical protein